MNQELLDRLKAEPGVPGMTLMLIAEIERLQNELSLSGVVDTMAKFTAEIERLEAQNRALVAAVRPVIEQADLGARQIGLTGKPIFEIFLEGWEVDRLRMAMAEAER